MAQKSVLVSDISGETISNGTAMKVTLSASDGRRFELDASEAELETLIAAARPAKRRGRPPKKS
jgi:hypothetical protein